MKPDDFWKLTYVEFLEILRGFEKSIKNKTNEMIASSWQTARLMRADKLPELSELLISDNEKPQQQQTPEQMLATCKMLNAAYGGNVLEVCDAG